MRAPSDKILENYANILVGFALGGEQGILPGDVVMLQIPECAKPILIPLQKAVLQRGGHPLIRFIPNGVMRSFFEEANQDQLTYRPQHELLGRSEDIDHMVSILSTRDKHELEGIDSSKIMTYSGSGKFYADALHAKEHKGEFSFTMGLYGTPEMAEEVGMTVEEYREQIIQACYLDAEEPITQRKEVSQNITKIKEHLNSLPIERLHVKGEDVDLKVKIGKHRQRLGGTGRNIPSFEVFISPDRRGTEGWFKSNQPLYRYGNLISGIEIRFSEGKVVESRAVQNEDVLHNMIATQDADKIGEFSLTDTRFSRIQRFMGETLYDENVGGPNGNTHIALGMAYKDSYPGDIASVTQEQREEMGYNDSVVHTDIVSTSDRTVVATLSDGTEEVIYQAGKFTFLDTV